jgi:hypothetical protein
MYDCDQDIRDPEWLHLKRKPKGHYVEWHRRHPRQIKGERLFGQVRTIEANVGLEFSLIPEVECVTIQRQEDGKGLQVLTVVNDRSPEIRSKIYKREQALIDSYPMFEFDFHIVSRMGRPLSDVIRGMGEISFIRK